MIYLEIIKITYLSYLICYNNTFKGVLLRAMMTTEVYVIIEPPFNDLKVYDETVEFRGSNKMHILLREREEGRVDFKSTLRSLLAKYEDSGNKYSLAIRDLTNNHGFYVPSKLESFGETKF